MNELTVTTPDTKPMESAGTDLVTRAESTAITDDASYQLAGGYLIDVKALVKKVEAEFKAPKAAAYAAHKEISALEKRMLEAPAKAEEILKRKMGTWQVAERERIRKEEDRLREEARKEAEARAKLEREEAQRQAEADRKAEEERRLQEATELEDAGQPELAEAVIAAPIVAPVYVPPPPVYVPPVSLPKPAVKGITTVMQKDFRIVDASKIDRKFLVPDLVKIRAQVAALGKDAEGIVGGIEFFEAPVTRVGGR